MKLQLIPNILTNKQDQKPRTGTSYPSLAPLRTDMVSFGAIKKTELSGFDLACANMFTAPLEKFNSVADFSNWAKEKLDATMNLEKYIGANDVATKEIRKTLKEWKDYLSSDDFYKSSPALSLIIFSAVLKDISPDRETLPPSLHKGVLASTVESLQSTLEQNNKANFDFNKLYQNNLRVEYMPEVEEVEEDPNAPKVGVWVKIPSKIHDPENFDKNVEKLKALSHKVWCTRAFHAVPYLEKGDFHIYIENNQPKVALRIDGDKLYEIAGEENNQTIPLKYLDEIKAYIKKNKIEGAERLLTVADKVKMETENAKVEFKTLKEKLKVEIAAKDYAKILPHLGIECKTLENGLLELSHYRGNEYYSFEDLGINENELFQKIERIRGAALFRYSKVTDLGQLQSIGGNAFFSYSKITNLGKLQSIEENAIFSNSKIENLGQLKSIGGYAEFAHSKVESLGQLQSIGETAYFQYSKVKDFGQLQSIRQDAYFDKNTTLDYSKIKIRGKVKLV